MSASRPWRAAITRPVALLTAGALLAVLLVWLFVFFVPQSHKLSSLRQEETSLNVVIAQDNARVQSLKKEAHHVGEIRAMETTLEAYVPATEELYTYIHVLSAAAKTAGVSITSFNPGTLTAVSGTPFSAVPITATIKATYSHLVAFIRDVYALPRLTDINGLNFTGGGTGSGTAPISASFDLAIFTSQKPS
jgi:Tfp pilus assembly protein PilO